MNELIYLDHNATTPLASQVLAEMMPYFGNLYGNAASSHAFGLQAKRAVDTAREKTAQLIGAHPQELVFTSGATESINLALKGLAAASPHRRHILTVATEHKAVLDVTEYLETIGYEITYLPVQADGIVELAKFKEELRQDTLVACVMFVNNETGVIQPIQQLAELTHEVGAHFMSDATQAVGKTSIEVAKLGIDLMPFSAHKFCGPKGTGALYIRRQESNPVKMAPLQHGGGHEKGFRSGTLNVAGIVGLGAACSLAEAEMEAEAVRVGALRDQLEHDLLRIPGSFVNGNPSQRLWNVTNVCFPGLEGNLLVRMLPDIAVSNGSACTSAVERPSHVLRAMGLSESEAFGSIRFSLGRGNEAGQLEAVIQAIRKNTARG